MAHVPGATYTDMGWEVYPDGFHACLARVARDYAPPAIYVTENGAAFGDVRLPRRLGAAIPSATTTSPGTSTRSRARSPTARRSAATTSGRCSTTSSGPHGYAKRFGIVYVDYATLERVPKASFYWYRDFAAARREEHAWPASA